MYKTFSANKVDVSKLVDPEAFKRLESEVNAIAADNVKAYCDAMNKWEEMLKLARGIYGEKSDVVRYLHKHRPHSPSTSVRREWEKVVSRLWKHKQDVERKERARKARELKLERERAAAEARRASRQAYRIRQAEARAELEAQGYIAGEHYPKNQPLKFMREALTLLPDGSYAPRGLPEPAGDEIDIHEMLGIKGV